MARSSSASRAACSATLMMTAAPKNTAAQIRASRPIISIPQHVAADDQPHHLVGAFQYLVHAHVAQDALDWMVAHIAQTDVQWQSAVDRLETGVGGQPL